MQYLFHYWYIGNEKQVIVSIDFAGLGNTLQNKMQEYYKPYNPNTILFYDIDV